MPYRSLLVTDAQSQPSILPNVEVLSLAAANPVSPKPTARPINIIVTPLQNLSHNRLLQ